MPLAHKCSILVIGFISEAGGFHRAFPFGNSTLSGTAFSSAKSFLMSLVFTRPASLASPILIRSPTRLDDAGLLKRALHLFPLLDLFDFGA
jgi:hypothetical protein